MPKGAQALRPHGWQTILARCAGALKAGELCPMLALPGVHPLTKDDFTVILRELEELGVEIVQPASSENLLARYKRPPFPPGIGYAGLFEITVQPKGTLGYWLFSDSQGGHFARTELKP